MNQTRKNIPDTFSPIENSQVSTSLETYLEKTDLLLYRKILDTLIKDIDNMETQRLGELMGKMSELYNNLSQMVLRKKREELFLKEYKDVNKCKQLRIESVKSNTLSLRTILQTIREQKEKKRYSL